MRCLLCDQDMNLVTVEPHELIDLPGFERHTFQCPQCRDTEQRLVFNRVETHPIADAAPTVPAAPPSPDDEDREQLKRLFSKLKITIRRI